MGRPSLTLLLALTLARPGQLAAAFAPVARSPLRRISLAAAAAGPDGAADADGSAALLSAYLVRAHEEKLRAVRAAQAQKDVEIAALREELARREAGGGAGGAALSREQRGLLDLPKEQLVEMVLQYQQFLADYVVKASHEKLRAVQEAKQAVLRQLGAPPAPAPVSSSPDAAVRAADHGLRSAGPDPVGLTLADRVAGGAAAGAATAESSTTAAAAGPYQARNERLLQQGAAGRWSRYELDRIQDKATMPVYQATAVHMIAAPVAATAPGREQLETVIQAADHGLRADGGVGGLTLRERVNLGVEAVQAFANIVVNGATVGTEGAPSSSSSSSSSSGYSNIGASITSDTTQTSSSTTSTSGSDSDILYQKRNENVLMAAMAGITRWGAQEIARIQAALSISSASPSLSRDDMSKIAAADHGLGSGGVSLLDRISQGFHVGQAATAKATGEVSEVNILYDERNKNVLKQGTQSRWGSHEIQRIQFRNSTGVPVSA